MQEYWFCEQCRSMNRATATACYRCHAPRARAAFATVRERAPGVVLTPGLDEEHRQVAWSLMARNRYISAWQLGYVTTALLAFAVVALTVMSGMVLMLSVTKHAVALEVLFADLPALQQTVLVAGAATVLIAVVVHSCFLGLTASNVPALGGGTSGFEPLRAAVWWIESALWALRASLAFVVPPILCFISWTMGGAILGLSFGLVWFGLALHVLGDPITALTRPARLLNDLYLRLALPDSPDGRLVAWWSMAWGVARGIAVGIAGFVFIVLLIVIGIDILAFFTATFNDEAAGGLTIDVSENALMLLMQLVLIVQVVADVVALLLLTRITYELALRQRVRERWVLSGLQTGGGRGSGVVPVYRSGDLPGPPTGDIPRP